MEHKLTVREELEDDLYDQIENSYSIKAPVVGLDMVKAGHRPLFTSTVYQLSGDDTSGIAGLLYPSGEFIEVSAHKEIQDYWNSDETLKYEKVPNICAPSKVNPGAERVVGNSWTQGEVLWDGISAVIDLGIEMETEVHINSRQQDKGTLFNKTFKQKVVVHIRREDKNPVTGDWQSTGELQRAIEQGVSMRHRGPVAGGNSLRNLPGSHGFVMRWSKEDFSKSLRNAA